MPTASQLRHIFEYQRPCTALTYEKALSKHQHLMSIDIGKNTPHIVIIEPGQKLNKFGLDPSKLVGLPMYGSYHFDGQNKYHDHNTEIPKYLRKTSNCVNGQLLI